MKKVFCILLFFVFHAHAKPTRPSGYELGNGGNILTCSQNSQPKEGAYSLDYIEGLYIHGLPPASSLQKMASELEIVDYVLEKLSSINPTRAILYKQWLDETLSSREFIENFSFLPIPDSGTSFIPDGCKQEQAAIFITSPGKKIRFLFKKNLWEKASPLSRAYLLMHELIYREARLPENLHNNSGASRYFNAWLMSNVDQLKSEEMVVLLQELGFKRTDYNGIGINLNSRILLGNTSQLRSAPISYFKDSGKIKKATLADSFSIRIGDELFQRVCNDSFKSKGFYSFVEFYPSGKVKKMHFDMFDGYASISDTPGYTNTNCNFHGTNYLEFDELGHLVKAEAKENSMFENFED